MHKFVSCVWRACRGAPVHTAQVCVMRVACVQGCTGACVHMYESCDVAVGVQLCSVDKYVSCVWRACRSAITHACTNMCHWCGVRARVHLLYAGLRQVGSYLYCSRRLPLTPSLGTHTQQTSHLTLPNQLWYANQL